MNPRDPGPPESVLAAAAGVRRLALALAADVHRAEDLAQDAWLRALQRRPWVHGEDVRPWFSSVVRNLVRLGWRQDARRAEREHLGARPEAQPSSAEVLEHAELHRTLVAEVMALREPFREALLLRYLQGLPPRVIAKRLAVPVSTVNARLARGLALLRERLDQESWGDRTAWCLALVSGLRQSPKGPAAVSSIISSFPGVLVMSLSNKLVLALVGVVILAGIAFLGRGILSVEPPEETRGDDALPFAVLTPGSAELVQPARHEPDSDRQPASIETEEAAPQSAAPAQGTLLLRVTWHDGTPAAGIGVFVQPSDAVNPFEGSLDAQTESDGTCRIDDLAPGRAYVRLDRRVPGVVDVRAGEQVELSLTIPNGIDVQGIVVDAAGSPVAGQWR